MVTSFLDPTPEQAADGIFRNHLGLNCKFCGRGEWTDPHIIDDHRKGKPHQRKKEAYLRNFGPHTQSLSGGGACQPAVHAGGTSLPTVETRGDHHMEGLHELQTRLCVGNYALVITDVPGEAGGASVSLHDAVLVLQIGRKYKGDGWVYVRAPSGDLWLPALSVQKIPPPPRRPCPRP